MIPDFCEALVGYRSWQIDTKGYLRSANDGILWPARKAMRARCDKLSLPHFDEASGALLRAPQRGCSCGLYAFKPAQPYGGLAVSGEVKVWGRIIEHASGYRAEYAYPSRLVVTDARLAARLRWLYGVECVVEAVAESLSNIGAIQRATMLYRSGGPAVGMSSGSSSVQYYGSTSAIYVNPNYPSYPSAPPPPRKWRKLFGGG